MDVNPYQPPGEKDDGAPRIKNARFRSLAGIFLGGVVIDFLGTRLMLQCLAVLIDLLEDAPMSFSFESLTYIYNMVARMGGLFLSFAGGFVSANVATSNIANTSPYHGIWHGLSSVALAHALIMPIWIGAGLHLSVVEWVGLVGCFLVAGVGGKLGQRNMRRSITNGSAV